MTAPIIGYAGLTHLGLCSAVAAGAKGFKVLGYDRDGGLVAALEKGEFPIVEPGLDHMFASHGDNLSFTSAASKLKTCDVVFISVDVPTDDSAASDLTSVDDIIGAATPHLNDDAVLSILCQVPPGYTRRQAVAPERLFCQVETLIFGRAVERATKPERFIIGCADAAKQLPGAYRAFLEAFDCPILPMGYESAELAKIAINCFLVASVSTTNTLSELCERSGAEWSEIAPALRLDARIGPQAYLNPGLGIAGGNLERDLATVCRMAADKGTDAGVIESYRANSIHAKEWPWRTLERAVLSATESPRIAVLGLAYKENTDSTKNAASLALLSHLKGHDVRVYDPVVCASTVSFATAAETSMEAVEGADAVVITTPWPEFRQLDPARLAGVMNGRTVIDPHGLLDGQAALAAGLDYYRLGQPALVAGGEGNA